MSAAIIGATLGAMFSLGVCLVLVRIRALRRLDLKVRVLPYLADVRRSSPALPGPSLHGGAGCRHAPVARCSAPARVGHRRSCQCQAPP